MKPLSMGRLAAELRLAVRFLRELGAHSRDASSVRQALSDFGAWRASQVQGSPLDDRTPWLTFGARRQLLRIVDPGDTVFEYGSGGSTLFLAERSRIVHTVEHDPEWFIKVKEKLESRGLANVTLELREPRSSQSSNEYGSTDARYRGLSFIDYASHIDQFPDDYFDLVIIDGRARPSCFAHAHRKVRDGGWVVLDNSERSEYHSILELADVAGWQTHHCLGPGPYVPYFWRTTFLRKAVPNETPAAPVPPNHRVPV